MSEVNHERLAGEHGAVLEMLVRDLAQVQREQSSHGSRISALEKSDSNTGLKLNYIVERIDSLVHKFDAFSEKPQKRMDVLIAILISAPVGAVLTTIVNLIFDKVK